MLEIWRDLNRDRDREPSSLLQQAVGISRKPPSLTEQAIANIKRELSSPAALERQMLARAIRQRPLSPVEQVIARIGPEMSSPEMREKLRRRQELLKACGVVERVLGPPVPVQPTQPDETEKPKRKRASGAGRHPMLTQEQIDNGIIIVRNNPAMSWKQLRRTLRDAGIDAGDTTLNTHIIGPARASR